MVGETEGEIETEDGVLVIRRIHVCYRLQASDEHADAIQRAFEFHPPKCPVYRTLSDSIDLTPEFAVVAET